VGPNVIMIILYPVGIPLFFLFLLLRERDRFNDPIVKYELGFLYDGYIKDMWWFELVDMVHKLILTSLLAFLPPDGQIPFGMAICMSYVIIILIRKPYHRKGDDRLSLFAQVEIFLLMLAGYVFFKTGLDEAQDMTISVFLILATVGFMLVFLVQSANILRKLLTLGLKQSRKDLASDPLGLSDLDPKTKQAAEVLLNTLERLSGKKNKKVAERPPVRNQDEMEMVRPNVRSSASLPRPAPVRRKNDEEISGPSMMIRNPLFIQAKSQLASHSEETPATPSQTGDNV
jgi:hypothetical protein